MNDYRSIILGRPRYYVPALLLRHYDGGFSQLFDGRKKEKEDEFCICKKISNKVNLEYI